jgi:hypothetical protein
VCVCVCVSERGSEGVGIRVRGIQKMGDDIVRGS